MRKKILLGAGHQNCQYNSIKALRRSTGAPNEMAFNVDICNQVASELRARGFDVKQTDANANDDPDVTGQDWDLALFVHYDADVYSTGGGFIDTPDPSVDYASTESERIVRLMKDRYFEYTKIAQHPERSNANTRFYYMWKFLTAKTPCALIECGVGMHIPNDHEILHFNRPLVVKAIVLGICDAFDVEYKSKTIDPSANLKAEKAMVDQENARLTRLNKELSDLIYSTKDILQNTIEEIDIKLG